MLIPISSATGSLKIHEAYLDISTNSLTIHSATLTSDVGMFNISSGSFDMPDNYTITKAMNPYDIIKYFEEKFYFTRTLPDDVKEKLIQYMTRDVDGNIHWNIDVANTTYFREYVLGVAQIMLMQPEYVMQTYAPQFMGAEPSYNSFYGNNSKLVIMQALGGTDWLHVLVPKDEYATYVENRWVGALNTSSDLVSLDNNYYLNSNLADFKPIYDEWNLKIFNRAGTPYHSRAHDSAQRAMSSQKSLFESSGDGFIGWFTKDEDPIKTVALSNGWQALRWGNFLNIWSNAYFQIRHSVSGNLQEYRLNTLRDIYETRVLSPGSSDTFRNAIKVDQISRDSQAAGWRAGGWFNMEQNFTFVEQLFDAGDTNVVGMRIDGSYDTHSDQKERMEKNFANIGTYIADFFNKMKAKEDITLVWFTEFGRTNKINSSDGTDHGQWGGMFVFTNNQKLKARLQDNVYGNLSFEKSQHNWLGVWVDYRTVHKIILEELYNKDLDTLFDLDDEIEDYVDTTASQVSLFREEYEWRNSTQSRVHLVFNINDANFRPSGASYVRFGYWTDKDNLREVDSRTIMREWVTAEWASIRVRTDVREWELYYYEIIIYDDQYNEQVISGEFMAPEVKNTGEFTLELDTDTRLRSYENMVVNGTNILADPMVLSTSTWVTIEGQNARIKTWTWVVIESVSADEPINWSGIFKIPQDIPLENFIDPEAKFVEKIFEDLVVEKIVKIGWDKLGLQMNLNKAVQVEVDIPNTSKNYIVLESEDGINWSKNTSDIIKTTNSVQFTTDHFSFFALVESDETWNPLVKEVIDTDMNTSWNAWSSTVSNPIPVVWSSWGGRSRRSKFVTKDICPYGDFTGNYYDRECWKDPESDIATANYDNPEMYGMWFSTMRTSDIMENSAVSELVKKPKLKWVNTAYITDKQTINEKKVSKQEDYMNLPDNQEEMNQRWVMESVTPNLVVIKKYRVPLLQSLYSDVINSDITDSQKDLFIEKMDGIYQDIMEIRSLDLSSSELSSKKKVLQSDFVALKRSIENIWSSQVWVQDTISPSLENMTLAQRKAFIREKIRKINKQREQNTNSSVNIELMPENIRKDDEDEEYEWNNLTLAQRKAFIREKIRKINKKNNAHGMAWSGESFEESFDDLSLEERKQKVREKIKKLNKQNK